MVQNPVSWARKSCVARLHLQFGQEANSNRDQICCFADVHKLGGITIDSVAVASLCSEEEGKKVNILFTVRGL